MYFGCIQLTLTFSLKFVLLCSLQLQSENKSLCWRHEDAQVHFKKFFNKILNIISWSLKNHLSEEIFSVQKKNTVIAE